MSQRSIGEISFPPRSQISETLLNLEFNLRNEVEIIEACLKLADGDTLQNMQEDILSVSEQFQAEIKVMKDLIASLNRSRGPVSSDTFEQFNMSRLRYNKLLLQVEKLYSSSPSISAIANRFPRNKTTSSIINLQATSNNINNNNNNNGNANLSQMNNLVSQLTGQPQQQNNNNALVSSQYANQKSLCSLSRIQSNKPPLSQQSSSSLPQNKVMVEDIIKGVIKRDNYTEQNKEFIKKELIQLKGQVAEVSKKLDTHEHSEYELELDQLRKDNVQIQHDYKILKNDNTELMHSLRTLQKMAMEIKLSNERLLFGFQNHEINSRNAENAQKINEVNGRNKQVNSNRNSQQYDENPSPLIKKEKRDNSPLQQNPNQLIQRISQNYQATPSAVHNQQSLSFNSHNNTNRLYLNQENDNKATNSLIEDKTSASRIINRNNSKPYFSEKQDNNLEQQHSRSVGKRYLIPDQQSDKDEQLDFDLLSSWARKRILDE